MSADNTSTTVDAVVLAAGKGTRMKSDLAKVLHEVAGRSLLAHVLATVRGAGIDRTVVVVGHQADRVQQSVAAADLEFVIQQPQLGTGHAVQVAAPALRSDGYTVVLAGDVPMLRIDTLRRLITGTVEQQVGVSILTCVVPDAGAYGRIVKDNQGRVLKIVEARDATPAELEIGEYNTGIFCFRTDLLVAALDNLTTDNDQGEYYLTDTVAYLVAQGYTIAAVATEDADEVVGINTVAELATAEQIYYSREA